MPHTPVPCEPSSSAPHLAPRLTCAVRTACVCALLALLVAQVAQAEEADGNLVWVDRSTSLLNTGVQAVVLAPASPTTIYAGGRGYVARSEDAGVTWKPVLLLVGAELQTSDQQIVQVEVVDDDDLERFDDSDALSRYYDERDELLGELEERYGEEFAETLIADLEADLREEAFAELIDEAARMTDERDYQARLQRLLSAGFEEDEAQRLASDPMAVRSLVVDPAAPDWVYAATGRGLYRSRNRGETWERVLSGGGVEEQGVLAVAIGEQGKALVAATTAGLLVSNDGGRTWQPTVGALASEPVRDVVATPSRAGRYFALSTGGLYRTDDGGVTWTPLTVTGFRAADAQDVNSPVGWSDTVLVATGSGVFRSDDGGERWHGLGTAGLGTLVDARVIFPTDDPDHLALVSEQEIYLTRDGGKTWTRASSGLVGQSLYDVAAGSDGSLWLGTGSGLMLGLVGQDAALAAEAIHRLEKVWTQEPSPAETLWAALVFQGLLDVPTEHWRSRMRLSHLAPQLRLDFQGRQERVDREYVTYHLPDLDTASTIEWIYRQQRYGQIVDPAYRWDIMATWDLGRMLYDPGEMTVELAGQTLRTARKRLAKRVVRLLVQRRALQMRAAARGQVSQDVWLSDLLELEEMTALLDGMTGNYFSATVEANRNQPTSQAPLGPIADRVDDATAHD